MSFAIPGQIISRHTLTANGTSVVTFTYPAETNQNRKANGVLINYVGTETLAITLDGTDPSITAPSFVGFDIATEQTIFVFGKPTIKLIGGIGNDDVVEVYLIYSPGMGN